MIECTKVHSDAYSQQQGPRHFSHDRYVLDVVLLLEEMFSNNKLCIYKTLSCP